jgi:hypothetical protein
VLRQLEGRGQPPLAGRGEEGVRPRPTSLTDAVLQQPVSEDDVRPRKILAAVFALDHEPPVVRHELQIERGDRRARVAAAGRSSLHVQQPVGEIEVARLDQLDEPLAVGKRLALGVAEHGIALQLHEAHRRREPLADQLGQLTDDRLGVLELGAGEERRVSRDVGQQQIAPPGDGVEVAHAWLPSANRSSIRGRAEVSRGSTEPHYPPESTSTFRTLIECESGS